MGFAVYLYSAVAVWLIHYDTVAAFVLRVLPLGFRSSGFEAHLSAIKLASRLSHGTSRHSH